MIHQQCCKNQPIVEVLYNDENFNEGKPIKVCRKHWEREDLDVDGVTTKKTWQRFTKSVKILEVAPTQ